MGLIGRINQTIATNNNNNQSKNTTPASSSINVDFSTEKKKPSENLTPEQLANIEKRYPYFKSLSSDKQEKIIKEVLNPEQPNETDTTTQETEETDSTPEKTEKTSDFNRKEFVKQTDLRTKADVIGKEIAKNAFMYGDKNNPKTEEDWNNLSEEQKNKYINNVKAKAKEYETQLQKTFSKIDETNQISTLNQTMSYIQAANRKGITFDEFMKLSSSEKNDVLYEYLETVDKSTLTGADKEFYDTTSLMSSAVKAHFTNKGVDTSTICAGDIPDLVQKEDLNIQSLEFDYLKNKINTQGMDGLSEYEKATYETLSKITKSSSWDTLVKKAQSETPDPNAEPSLYAKIQESEFADRYNNATYTKKPQILIDILQKKYSNNPQKGYEEALRCAEDAQRNGNTFLAQNIMQEAYKKFNIDSPVPKNKELSVNQTLVLSETVGLSNKAELTKALAEHINNGKDVDIRIAANSVLIENTSDDNLPELTSVKFKDEEVQIAGINRVDEVEDLDMATQCYNNINSYASQEAKNYAAANADKAYKNCQTTKLDIFTANNVEATQAAIDSETITRFDKDNQTIGFKTLKNRAESLMQEKDAINALNTLSDQIQKCDKDNQLAMHDDIMSSKYSQVQEHAAGNIKNYDATVQTEAVDRVLASGNQGAIDATYENIGKYAPVVDTQLTQAIANAVNETNAEDELTQKIKSGETLTLQEYYSLSASERLAYKTSYFKALSTTKQVELLTKLSNSSDKKSIYKQIASSNQSLLVGLIENDADTAKYIYNLHIADNLVTQVAKQKASSQIGYSNLLKEIENDLEQDKKKLDYASNPLGKKDRNKEESYYLA